MVELECWRLILDTGLPGPWNMALDDALTESIVGGAPFSHTVRLYWFAPACLSIGAAQPIAEVDVAACRQAEVEIVRRPSGGRAVLHDGCLTYAVSGPLTGAVFRDGIRPSYKRIALALQQALVALGVEELQLAGAGFGGGVSPSCFDHASPLEPLSRGQKLVGSAQTRRRSTALQHGSLRLRPGRVAAASLLRRRAGAHGETARPEPWSVAELLGRQVSRDEAVQALAYGFATTFGVKLLIGRASEDELAAARSLERERYAADCWTLRF